MTRSPADPPALSAVSLGGALLAPLPKKPLQPLVDLAVRTVRSRHASVFERLADLDAGSIAVEPTDLPVGFLLSLGGSEISLTVYDSPADPDLSGATIRAPLLTLIDLLEGRLDGDALFFSRDLKVVGDMELVVALRNAVDDAEIDLIDDLLSVLGPLAQPARRFADQARGILDRASRDIDALRRALVAPERRELAAQATQLNDVAARLTELATERRRRVTPARRP